MGSPWPLSAAFLALGGAAAVALGVLRVYLVERRYPTPPVLVAGGDPRLFAPKFALQVLALSTASFTALFWAHLAHSACWLIAPHVLEDSAIPASDDGAGESVHDAALVAITSLGAVCVALELFRHLRVFIFLVDWERGLRPLDSERGGFPGQFPALLQSSGGGGEGGGKPSPGGPQASTFGYGDEEFRAPDSGVPAWRTIFVCNQLKARLASTRTTSHFTWLAMAVLLEGLGLKNAARAPPGGALDPSLQFSLSGALWALLILAQLVGGRLASISFGHHLNDFIDVCSVANVSVLLMDEPYHGFYVHGRAPSGRGDWCHADLARVMHNEGKGIGMGRGITADGCQTFEMFLPPDLAIQVAGSGRAHFRQQLQQTFREVAAARGAASWRRQPLGEAEVLLDIARKSNYRCSVQALVDAFIHAVMRGGSEVVQARPANGWLWGATPEDGVASLRQPVFYRDQDGGTWPSGTAWSSCLARGAEARVAGVGFPTGFEWHLILLEFMAFSSVWRFQGSICMAATVSFILNTVVLQAFAAAGRHRLAYTTIISGTFLL